MCQFADEIREEYPELFQPAKQEAKPEPQIVCRRVVKEVRGRTPLYVLPIILTLIILCSYVGVSHIRQKQMAWNNERHMITIEEKLVKANEDVAKHRDAIGLVAILHNENFASMRQATGNQDLIFINKNWKIDRIPKYLNLTEDDIKTIKEKYIVSLEQSLVKYQWNEGIK